MENNLPKIFKDGLKSPSYGQFLAFVLELERDVVGARLQSVHSVVPGSGPQKGPQKGPTVGQKEELWLELYRGQVFYLVFGLHKMHPQVLLSFHKPKLKKKVTPVSLFLQSHFESKTISKVVADTDRGRVLSMEFGSPDYALQFDCIPHQANLKLTAAAKKISYRKPLEIKPFEGLESQKLSQTKNFETLSFGFQSPAGARGDLEVAPEEPWLDLWTWSKFYFQNSDGQKVTLHTKAGFSPLEASKRNASLGPSAVEKQILKKKQRALSEIADELDKKNHDLHKLESEVLLLPPAEQGQTYDSIKKIRSKIQRTRERQAELERELAGSRPSTALNKINENLTTTGKFNLKHPPVDPSFQDEGDESEQPQEPPQEFSRSGFKKLKLGKFWVFRGRNGEENLDLLRQSRSWDYWIHLRDEPGAYGILRRNKNEDVPAQILGQAAQWLIRESVKRKWLGEEKFPVVICEVKFVRPIKGAAKGLVTYKNAKHFVVASSSRR